LGGQVGDVAGPVAPCGWVCGGFVEGGEAVIAGEFGKVTVGEELLGGLGGGDVGDAAVTPAGGGESAVGGGGVPCGGWGPRALSLLNQRNLHMKKF